MTSTESTIREFLATELLYDKDVTDLAAEDSLIEAGLLDSIAILKTVTFCEETFNVTIPDEEVLPDHFETVRAIANLVDRHRASK